MVQINFIFNHHLLMVANGRNHYSNGRNGHKNGNKWSQMVVNHITMVTVQDPNPDLQKQNPEI